MMTAVKSGYEPTMDLSTGAQADIAKYLSRPVEIDTASWAVASPLFQKINPWALWTANKWVAQKLSNYELLRCKLHIKMVINGSQFHYGKVMVGYNPFASTFDEVTTTRNFLDQDLVQLSQKPHVFLDPSDAEGASMLLPWFWNDNYLSLTKNDVNYMGDLYYKSMGNLNVTSTGTNPVTITTYAWAEDIVLTMPTSLNEYTTQSGLETSAPELSVRDSKPYKMMYRALPILQILSLIGSFAIGFFTRPCEYEPQSGKGKGKGKSSKPSGKPKKKAPAAMNSGDEYGKGIISQPASAIAKAAGALEMIPFIAPYARATSMVATKVGQIASLFGYSRPNVLTDVAPFKPSLAGVVANVNAADTSAKLSLDAKQEVCIDPRISGLDGEDEMTMKSLVCRESYVTSFSMAETDSYDAILWNTYVNPAFASFLTNEIHMTPACLWSQHFKYWSGSMKFRFQIIKTKFHKGRLLFRWDPRSNSSTVATNAVYSRIVDIAQEEDFEIVIGWGQSEAFLNTITCQSSAQLFSASRLTTDSSEFHNGVLECNVVNTLVSPDGASPIRINVYVSMCEDAKFGAPYGTDITALSPFVPQGGYEPQSGTDDKMPMNELTDHLSVPTRPKPLATIAEEGEDSDETYNIFFGETITSLRELMKRYYFHRGSVRSTLTTNAFNVNRFTTKARPYVCGWDPAGLNLTDFSVPLTVGNNGPIQLWSMCFAGWRGSLRHKLVLGEDFTGSQRVRRVGYTAAEGWSNTATTTVSGDTANKFLSAQTARRTYDGTYVNHNGFNKIAEVEVPFYTSKRFLSSRIIAADSLPGDSLEMTDTYSCGATAPSPSYVEDWVAAGDDYSLLFFTGVPILYRYYVTETTT